MALLNTADDVLLGTVAVDRVYVGTTLVWQRASDDDGFGLAPFGTSPYSGLSGFGLAGFGNTGFGE
jgi:hypothetical protein